MKKEHKWLWPVKRREEQLNFRRTPSRLSSISTIKTQQYTDRRDTGGASGVNDSKEHNPYSGLDSTVHQQESESDSRRHRWYEKILCQHTRLSPDQKTRVSSGYYNELNCPCRPEPFKYAKFLLFYLCILANWYHYCLYTTSYSF